MKRVLVKSDTELKTIIFDGEVIYLSPTALKLLIYMVENPADQYSTGALRDVFGMRQSHRNFRPYFLELQGLGLVEVGFSYGVVAVSNLARRAATVHGLPVFER
ncbi:TPA: hypothetical protein NUW95_004903 [Escherichia coli]|nr:hypothetical protein [Escherichia coli]